jgi:hypothetical protein
MVRYVLKDRNEKEKVAVAFQNIIILAGSFMRPLENK